MTWQEETLMLAGVAAWIGSMLQCRLAAHQYADEEELKERLRPGGHPFDLARNIMFHRPRSLRDAPQSEVALQHAQAWFWVNFATALVVGTGIAAAMGIDLHGIWIVGLFVLFTFALVIVLLKGGV